MMSLKKVKNYNSIGIYDKCNNLVDYVEFQNDDDIKCYYSVNGNVLNRKYTNVYEGEVTELVSSVIEYDNNIMLYPLSVQGETAMRTIQSGASFTSFIEPGVSSRVDFYDDYIDNDSGVQCFSVKSELIDEWLNKV